MMRLMMGMLLAAAVGLGSCAHPGSKAGQPDAAKQVAANGDQWRPAWWQDKPIAESGHTSVCAFADDADLLTARQNAVKAGRHLLADAQGGMPAIDDAATRTDSVRLSNGVYRAFVRLTSVGG